MTRFDVMDLQVIERFRELEPTLFDLHGRFLEEYGNNLSAMQPRFAQRHDPDSTITVDRFERLLGIDVAHDTHPIMQWHILEYMLRERPVNPRISSAAGRWVLKLTEITHDYGEAVLKEDVAFGDKAEDHEKQELAAWTTAISNVAPSNLKNFILDKVTPVLDGSDSTLHEIFDISEKIGYITTATRAINLLGECAASTELVSEDEAVVLRRIAIDVQRRVVPLCTPQRRISYPSLDYVTSEFTQLFSSLPVINATA